MKSSHRNRRVGAAYCRTETAPDLPPPAYPLLPIEPDDLYALSRRLTGAELSGLHPEPAVMVVRQALSAAADAIRFLKADQRECMERAFKAGYSCQWLREERRYIFDPALKPGDHDRAFWEWLRQQA